MSVPGPGPDAVVVTPRLRLRCWSPADAARLKDAVDASLAHLRPWMPWAWEEPSELPALESRLLRFREDFARGRDWIYGIWDRDEERVLGGTGLHPRCGAGALEIGYWIRVDATGRGLATEAAAALTRVGFERHGVGRLEIRCDPANAASAAVPRRLGYRLEATLLRDAVTPDGQPRDTQVHALRTDEFAGSAAAAVPVRIEGESSSRSA